MHRFDQKLQRKSLQQSLALVAAITFAYALDYLFNLSAGRLLAPAEFGILVALSGVGQVLVVASRVVQTVITRYVARFSSQSEAKTQVRAFFRMAFTRASWAGLVASLLFAAFSPFIAEFLRIDAVAPVLALAAAVWLMAVRPVVGGVLQGEQRFGTLGVIQVVQAALRLLSGVLFMSVGLGAFGGMAALPIASVAALGLGIVILGRSYWQPAGSITAGALSDLTRFSALTAVGLIGYALLVNMDAVLAKRFFDPEAAGNYSAAVTLGKIVQFFPLAIIMLLFPKAAQRRATRTNPAGVLFPALLTVGGLCGAVTVVYFVYPEPLVRLVFGDAYSLPGPVLGLLGLAMTLLSLGNVWLNYFLSTDRPRFVLVVVVGVVLQTALMLSFHDELWHLPAAMVVNGAVLSLTGLAYFWLGLRQQL